MLSSYSHYIVIIQYHNFRIWWIMQDIIIIIEPNPRVLFCFQSDAHCRPVDGVCWVVVLWITLVGKKEKVDDIVYDYNYWWYDDQLSTRTVNSNLMNLKIAIDEECDERNSHPHPQQHAMYNTPALNVNNTLKRFFLVDMCACLFFLFLRRY